MPSESPKWIALVLSVVALIISGLSWWESHRGRVINEAVSRPVLTIKQAYAHQATYGEDRVEVGLFVTLRNDGKAGALLTGGVVEPVLMVRRDCDLRLMEPAAFTEEILPGQEREFVSLLSLKASSACKDRSLQLDVTLKASYKDSGSGTEYSQTFFLNMGLTILDRVPTPTPTP
jgi:hypothetical protein